MDVIELVIDDEDAIGVEAISLVEHPAIEEDFIALKNQKTEFKTIDKDKRIVVGLALIPNKPIYRKSGDNEYYVFFSRNTVRKSAELYLKNHNSNNATLEHEIKVEGVSVVESWIVEDVEKDKTALYGLNAVEGAWAVVMRINNEKVWQDVKKGIYKGLSIEGYFADKMERPKEKIADFKEPIKEEVEAQELLSKIKNILSNE